MNRLELIGIVLRRVGPHGSETVNQKSTNFLDFARSCGLRVAGSWFQVHCWTWYSNAGGVAKEIDHMLIDGRWRLMQNCRAYRSAQFLNTDDRLVAATLKLQLKFEKIRPVGPGQFRLYRHWIYS